jgi:8-amino-7-oxononanoate synthase
VVVDEAHSTGVYGAGGRGITHAAGEATNLTANTGRATVRLMTFGKGVGCSGAVLLSSPVIRSFLINFARPFIFSTAMPLSTVHSIEAAWDLLSSAEGDAKRANLYDTIGRFYSLLNHVLASTPSDVLRLPDPSPVPFPRSTGSVLPPRPPAPIVGLLSPTPHALSAFLLERGFIVRPVVPPTVPPGGERVRICLRAGMDPSRLELLVDALRDWVVLKAAERAESVVEARAKL